MHLQTYLQIVAIIFDMKSSVFTVFVIDYVKKVCKVEH